MQAIGAMWGSAEYTYMAVGITYKGGTWYCCVCVSSKTTTDNRPIYLPSRTLDKIRRSFFAIKLERMSQYEQKKLLSLLLALVMVLSASPNLGVAAPVGHSR